MHVFLQQPTMSNSSLIKKERDFLEINKQLEDKVKSLMVEVDTIINKQEDVIRCKRRSSDVHRLKKAKLKDSSMNPDADKLMKEAIRAEDINDA